MNFVFFTYAVILCNSIGVSSADETIFAKDIIDKLNLILSRTMDIEEKLSDYEELKQGLDALNEKNEELKLQLDIANEKLKGVDVLKHEVDTSNEQLALLVKSVDKVESVYDCGWPELAYGHFEGKSTFYRDVLQAVCDEGFSLRGYENVTCKHEGTWSVLPECKQDCQAPPVLNSLEYGTDKTYLYDSRVEINCKLGYRRAGGRYKTCDGEYGWRGSDVQCYLVDCGLPAYDDNGKYWIGYMYNTTFNSTVSLTCNKGYVRLGQDVIRCKATGVWSGRQTCVYRICVDYTTESGINATECFLAKENFRLINVDIEILEIIPYRDPGYCLQYCLDNHPSLDHVELDRYHCRCVKRILSDEQISPTYYHNNYMYFREGESSAYKFLTAY